MLMLNDEKQYRHPFVAEGISCPIEYPPETIKETKCKPCLLYSENPKYSLLFDRQYILSVVTPNRREKMEDICEAKQIRYT